MRIIDLKLLEYSLAREKSAMTNVHSVLSIAQKYDNMGAELPYLVQQYLRP
ncbi:hypothetical protein Sjap_017873 [Stephania japonica]|uniref:Uncharacterized protein n=1 Tax=Stephania japonica TaxID=461633 RepID=A0AAP0I6Y8_9MAGN